MAGIGTLLASGISGFIAGDLGWLVVYAVWSALQHVFNPGLGVFTVDPLWILLSPMGIICGIICGAICMVGIGGNC